jgi:dTDP-4-amino-4,6-dideoxygalactose transaminase
MKSSRTALPNRSRNISLSQATLRGKEHAYIRDALESGQIAGNGSYTKRVEDLIAAQLGAPNVFLTHSCTAALEVSALLTVRPGDEVILPSFTFPSTGSAFARCGAKLVFVDIDADTLNIDPNAVEAALTPQTRAIVAMHYAGVGCDISSLRKIADAAGLVLIEDAAHGFGAAYRDRPLGTFGALAALSFNETKNVTSGEGGALVVNDCALVERARIMRDRGTNREQFIRGQVAEYSWHDLGSAYAPSDLIAAFLLAQVEDVEAITSARLQLWQRYHVAFEALGRAGCVRRPVVPAEAAHNGHIYHLLLADGARRRAILAELNQRGIGAAFHYVPLHVSPAGRKFGRAAGSLAVTDDVARRLIRLPLHLSMSEQAQSEVIDVVASTLNR